MLQTAVEAHDVKVDMSRVTVSVDVRPEDLAAASHDFTARWAIVEAVTLAAQKALLSGRYDQPERAAQLARPFGRAA